MKHKLTSIIRVIPIIFLMLLCINSAWGQDKKGKDIPKTLGICQEFNVEAFLNHDAQGCYWDVTYTNDYCDANTNIYGSLFDYPHGIEITVGGTTISSVTCSSPWINTASSGPTNLPGESTWSWTKDPNQNNSQSKCDGTQQTNAIPSGVPISMKVYIDVSQTTGPYTFTLNDLNCSEDPITHAFTSFKISCWGIPITESAPTPPAPPAIPQNPSICKGKTTVVELIPNVSPPAKIKWYKHEPLDCKDDCLKPTTIPPSSPWVEVDNNPPQEGVNSIATGILNRTTCYVAVIDSGCFRYLSTVARVEVCKPLTGISISPILGSQPLQTIEDKKRACNGWTGGLKLNYEPCCRMLAASWTLSINDELPLGIINVTNLTLDPPTDPSRCYNKYTFKATVSNACGTKSVYFTIYVDREITKDDITLTGDVWDLPPNLPSPLGPICYKQSARIDTEKKCNQIEIVEWQVMKWTPPGDANGTWVTDEGALGTSLYHTNRHRNPGPGIRSAWYRAGIKNGACTEIVWSDSFEIQVKPELTVSLSPLSGRLCPPNTTSITLTAISSYLPVTYYWYRNGVLKPGLSDTRPVNQPGEYYVVVSDDECNKTAKSDVIIICNKPIVDIVGPCVVCDNTEFDLTALVFSEPEGCTSDCVTFQWTASNGGNIISSPNTQTITANSAGEYTVLVTCGDCTLESSITVVSCPPVVGTCSIVAPDTVWLDALNNLTIDNIVASGFPGVGDYTWELTSTQPGGCYGRNGSVSIPPGIIIITGFNMIPAGCTYTLKVIRDGCTAERDIVIMR